MPGPVTDGNIIGELFHVAYSCLEGHDLQSSWHVGILAVRRADLPDPVVPFLRGRPPGPDATADFDELYPACWPCDPQNLVQDLAPFERWDTHQHQAHMDEVKAVFREGKCSQSIGLFKEIV